MVPKGIWTRATSLVLLDIPLSADAWNSISAVPVMHPTIVSTHIRFANSPSLGKQIGFGQHGYRWYMLRQR